jgi:hypothetical protein
VRIAGSEAKLLHGLGVWVLGQTVPTGLLIVSATSKFVKLALPVLAAPIIGVTSAVVSAIAATTPPFMSLSRVFLIVSSHDALNDGRAGCICRPSTHLS